MYDLWIISVFKCKLLKCSYYQAIKTWNIQCIQKVYHFFPFCYVAAWYYSCCFLKNSLIYTLYLIITKWKQNFRNVCKCIKNKNLKYHLYISMQQHWKFSSSASHFSRSLLRCFYTLIGVHLWSIKLIGHDLESHTPLYKRPHNWPCILRAKTKPWSQRNCLQSSETGLYRGTDQNISAALKVPKSTVASIILKWKKFGTTRTLPRAGRPAKLGNQCRRALSRLVTKNLMVTLVIIFADGRNLQKDNHHCDTPPIWALWRFGPSKSSPQWRYMKTHLEFAKQHLKDP